MQTEVFVLLFLTFWSWWPDQELLCDRVFIYSCLLSASYCLARVCTAVFVCTHWDPFFFRISFRKYIEELNNFQVRTAELHIACVPIAWCPFVSATPVAENSLFLTYTYFVFCSFSPSWMTHNARRN